LIDIDSVVWSFGLTKAAEDNNAENLLGIHDKKLSSLYTVNWEDHAQHSEVYGEEDNSSENLGDYSTTK
jgi:hypothetical protein